MDRLDMALFKMYTKAFDNKVIIIVMNKDLREKLCINKNSLIFAIAFCCFM